MTPGFSRKARATVFSSHWLSVWSARSAASVAALNVGGVSRATTRGSLSISEVILQGGQKKSNIYLDKRDTLFYSWNHDEHGDTPTESISR